MVAEAAFARHGMVRLGTEGVVRSGEVTEDFYQIHKKRGLSVLSSHVVLLGLSVNGHSFVSGLAKHAVDGFAELTEDEIGRDAIHEAKLVALPRPDL